MQMFMFVVASAIIFSVITIAALILTSKKFLFHSYGNLTILSPRCAKFKYYIVAFLFCVALFFFCFGVTVILSPLQGALIHFAKSLFAVDVVVVVVTCGLLLHKILSVDTIEKLLLEDAMQQIAGGVSVANIIIDQSEPELGDLDEFFLHIPSWMNQIFDLFTVGDQIRFRGGLYLGYVSIHESKQSVETIAALLQQMIDADYLPYILRSVVYETRPCHFDNGHAHLSRLSYLRETQLSVVNFAIVPISVFANIQDTGLPREGYLLMIQNHTPVLSTPNTGSDEEEAAQRRHAAAEGKTMN